MLLLAVAVSAWGWASGFPSGAPAESCESLLPRHFGTEAQGDSPYSFLASSSQYHYKMDGIQVELSGPRFKGFLVAAVDPESHERVGHWQRLQGTHTLPCAAISHADPLPKKRVVLFWRPPTDRPRGRVVFVATVLQSFEHYYSGLVARIPSMNHEEDDSD